MIYLFPHAVFTLVALGSLPVELEKEFVFVFRLSLAVVDVEQASVLYISAFGVEVMVALGGFILVLLRFNSGLLNMRCE
jgi:hypothetical protein